MKADKGLKIYVWRSVVIESGDGIFTDGWLKGCSIYANHQYGSMGRRCSIGNSVRNNHILYVRDDGKNSVQLKKNLEIW